jgi:LmbE family N-acetylglucosaminyl deacetylase
MTSFELRDHLSALQIERAAAAFHGLDASHHYVSDLETEIEATHHALVGAVVTEIASCRAQRDGPLIG